MKILIADSLSDTVVEALREAGHKVKMDPSLDKNTLENEICDYDVLVVRSTKVTRSIIEKGKNLSLIVRAGAGVNTIDIEAASYHGVFVSNTPGCNSDAVSELTIGHLIACDRQIVDNAENLRNGKWVKNQFLNCAGLKGKTLGLLGAGNIAQRVAKVAQAIGMNVIVYSYFFDEKDAERMGVTKVNDLMDIAKNSDAISIHIPYMKETHHLISKKFFKTMKNGAILINTARGEIIDTPEMINAIKTKGIKVGLDVYEDEPTYGVGDFKSSELARLVCSATCHIGGSTQQASELIAEETINVITTYAQTGKVLNCVNIDASPACDETLTIRHKGVLAQIIQTISSNGATIQSISSQNLSGGESQTVTLKIKGDVVSSQLKMLDGVLSVNKSKV